MTPTTSEVEGKATLYSIPLLAVLKAAQQQHGLRHADYQRYHQYLSRKLRRMRKSLHFQQGNRSKVVPKKLTADMVTDPRFILLKVFEIERSWAYAMKLKADSNTELRKEFQRRSRLRKAVLRGDQLSELISNLTMLDAQTLLELKAYIHWIHGIKCFESSNWTTAKEFFESTQAIYAGLMETIEEDSRDIYAARIEEILPQIHYCAYNIGDKSAASDLQRMRTQATKADSAGLTEFQLDQLLDQARASQAGLVTEIEWLGITIPVKSERAKMTILTVEESERELSKTDELKSRLSLYDMILKSCVESIGAVREEIRSLSSADGITATGAAAGRDKVVPGTAVVAAASSDKLSRLHLLYNYLQYVKLSKTIERTLLHITDALSSAGLDSSGQVRSGLGTSSYTKPQELSRLYDTIVQNLQEIVGLQGVVQELVGLKDLLQAKIVCYRSYRCYYLAFTYFHGKRFAECSALLNRSKRHAQEAVASLSPTTASWTECESEATPGPHPEQLIQALFHLITQAEAEDLTCKAAYMLDLSEVGGCLGGVNQHTEANLKLSHKALLNRMDHFTDVKTVEKSLTTQSHPFVQLPPCFEPVPVKPIFFDLALNYVNFPSLSDKVDAASARKDTSSGLAGFVRGWLWGGSSGANRATSD